MRCIEVAAAPCFYGAAAISFVGKVFCLIILQIMHCTLANVEDFASAEATKGLSGRPLETFGPLLRIEICIQNSFLAAGRKRAYLSFSRITKDFASAEATKGLSDRPLETFGALPM